VSWDVRRLLPIPAPQPQPTASTSPTPIVEELTAGEGWKGRANILGILAEEDSEIQINGSRLYPMKADEGLVITGILVTSVYVKTGKIKLIGFYLPQTALPRMIQQRSVTLYGVESAVLAAYRTFFGYDYANTWLPALKLYDYVVPDGEKWGLGGNMYLLASSLTVNGSFYVMGDALVEVV